MQVYFNLHKKSWSMRDPRTGRVVNKDQTQCLVVLRNVTFKVSEAGRQRVIREKRKNVHAFAVGDPVGFGSDPAFNDPGAVARLLASANVPVSYNPYKAGHFVRVDTGEAVHACTLLVMTTKMVEVLKEGKPTGVLKRVPVVKAAL
jgi:hypothetical protein